MNMNAVGIDVSKRKSTVAILRPGGKAVGKPFDVPHLSADFQSLIKRIRELEGETRIVMECTGRFCIFKYRILILVLVSAHLQLLYGIRDRLFLK